MKKNDTCDNISILETILKYKYNDTSNLLLAMTHSSYANENRYGHLESNERLEFLGDAVLNISISEHLYRNYPSLSEGQLTKARASIVCEPSLAKCSQKLELGRYLMLGKGEEYSGGRTRISILSDALEAVIGSIYLDGGFEKAKEFILPIMEETIKSAINGASFVDYKTQLQEVIQKTGDFRINYDIAEEKGPDHNKLFIVNVNIADKVMGTGEGRSKKEAEQNAASKALLKLEGQ